MNTKISPSFKMNLLEKIEKEIWGKYEGYKRAKMYISQWQEEWGYNDINFSIITKSDTENIDLAQTLSHIDDETILKIAVDLGIETPDFIPVIAEIENIFKVNYRTAQQTFQKALNQCYEHPENAVSLANSALESIIKHILNDEHFKTLDRRKTLYALTEDVLKEFKLFPEKEMPEAIKRIGSSLLKSTQSIEQLRSTNTDAHGKLGDDYIVHDSLYAFFIVNSVATIGLFLIGFYEKKFQPSYLTLTEEGTEDLVDDVPF